MDDQPDSVVIVGSGIIGIACAHYLNRAGLRVTVVDRGRLADECSKANCGYVCPSHVLPLTEPSAIPLAFRSLFNRKSAFRVKPQMRFAFWNWMLQFARRCTHRQMLTAGQHLKAILDSAMSEYRQLMVDEPMDCQWKETGLLYVLLSEQGLSSFEETDQFIDKHFGLKADFLNADELREFEPSLKPGLAGGYFYGGDASLRPDQLNAQWIRSLKARGVSFRENCQVTDVHADSGKLVALSTQSGPIKANQFVFAIGARSAQFAHLLGCRLPVEPGKGYSVTLERPAICPTRPMLFPEHKVGVSPFSDGYRLGSMMEFVGFDSSIPAARIQQLRDSASPYLQFPQDMRAIETWYGWRPMTWDSLPIIGPATRFDNAFVATGHNMLGLSMAPATGRLIAEMLTGQKPHLDPKPFSPKRFGP